MSIRFHRCNLNLVLIALLPIFSPCSALAGNPYAEACPEPFIRGDVDFDGFVNAADGLFLINALFVAGSPEPVCNDVADVDDDNSVTIVDPLALLRFVFLPGEPPPAEPYPDAGYDEQAVSGWVRCDRLDNDTDGLVDEGEGCDVSWARGLDAGGNDLANSASPTADGGYVIAGTSDLSDGFVTKVNSDGVEEWTYVVPSVGGFLSELYSVQQTSDGGYIAAGIGYVFGLGTQAYLLKLNPDGSPSWERNFGKVDNEIAYSVLQASDGGYVLAGGTDAPASAGGFDFYLLKVSADGDFEWQSVFGGSFGDIALSVKKTSDEGYILAGGTTSFGASGADIYLVKTDSAGVLQWEQVLGGNGDEFARDVQQTTDGGYVVGGATNGSGSAGFFDFYLIKTDAVGEIEWRQTYGGVGSELAESIAQTTDGGYIMAGRTGAGTFGGIDVYLVKAQSDGQLEWDRFFGGSENDQAYSVRQALDGGYILAGETRSFGTLGQDDVYLIKTDTMGNIAECSDLLDNDQDGFIDFPADPECFIPFDNSEEQ